MTRKLQESPNRHATSHVRVRDCGPLLECAGVVPWWCSQAHQSSHMAPVDKARKAAGVSFQFQDIRAKAATDTGDLAHAQVLLGHKRREMTEHYVKRRTEERVKPLR